MSTGRSSIGGRDSARTTALESPGSASSLSQASMSRTSDRSKYAAEPVSRKGRARSSSADPTAAPSAFTERTSTQISSGATPALVMSRSASAATCCAWARAERQCQKATDPPARPRSRFSSRSGIGATTACAASRILRPERWLRSSCTTVASGYSRWKSRMFFWDAPRKR